MIEFLRKIFKKDKKQYSYEEILNWFYEHKELSPKLSKLIYEKITNEGNQIRKLSNLEQEILMYNPNSIINLDGTIQYKGIILK